MENTDYTLLIVIINTVLNPFLNYILHSRCSEINICCIHCKRQIKDEISN